MDPHIVNTMRVNFSRVGSFRDDWDQLLKVFEGVASRDLTRRKLVLGDTKDSITGWYLKSFAEDTIEGILIPRTSSRLVLKGGTYVRTDGLLLTAAGFEEGDEVKEASGKCWEIKAVRDISNGDSFSHRECDLTFLPLHELV